MNFKSFIFVAAAAIVLPLGAEYIRPEIIMGKTYPFLSRVENDLALYNRLPTERGTVKITQDADNLYIYAEMKDTDVIAESTADQTNLNKTGDAIQIYLKPENETFVWELFADPNNHKSNFFHWGLGRVFYPAPEKAGKPVIAVNAEKGKGFWNVKITFPISEVRKQGLKFVNSENWTIMVIRNNYSRYLPKREWSSYPQAVKELSNPVFYAKLILNK